MNYVFIAKSSRKATAKRTYNDLISESDNNNSSGDDYCPNENDISDDDTSDETNRKQNKRKKMSASDSATKHSSPKRVDNPSKCTLNVEFRLFELFRYTIFDTSGRKFCRYHMHSCKQLLLLDSTFSLIEVVMPFICFRNHILSCFDP